MMDSTCAVMKSCIMDLGLDGSSEEESLEEAEAVRLEVCGRMMPTTCSSVQLN